MTFPSISLRKLKPSEKKNPQTHPLPTHWHRCACVLPSHLIQGRPILAPTPHLCSQSIPSHLLKGIAPATPPTPPPHSLASRILPFLILQTTHTSQQNTIINPIEQEKATKTFSGLNSPTQLPTIPLFCLQAGFNLYTAGCPSQGNSWPPHQETQWLLLSPLL